MTTKKKHTLRFIPFVIVLALLCTAGYWFYNKSIHKLQDQISTEQKQKELLEQRVSDVQAKLNSAEEEKASLLDSIDALMTTEEYYFDAAVIMEEIKDLGELATMEYRYTNVGTLDASKKLFKTNIDIPGTKKTAIVSMDGTLKIGIDVEKIVITGDEAAKTITIRLPDATLLSNELDEDSIQVYDETNGVFNKISLVDSASIRSEIKEKAEENAEKNGIKQQAKQNAQNIINCMLQAIPEVRQYYTIVFL